MMKILLLLAGLALASGETTSARNLRVAQDWFNAIGKSGLLGGVLEIDLYDWFYRYGFGPDIGIYGSEFCDEGAGVASWANDFNILGNNAACMAFFRTLDLVDDEMGGDPEIRITTGDIQAMNFFLNWNGSIDVNEEEFKEGIMSRFHHNAFAHEFVARTDPTDVYILDVMDRDQYDSWWPAIDFQGKGSVDEADFTLYWDEPNGGHGDAADAAVAFKVLTEWPMDYGGTAYTAITAASMDDMFAYLSAYAIPDLLLSYDEFLFLGYWYQQFKEGASPWANK